MPEVSQLAGVWVWNGSTRKYVPSINFQLAVYDNSRRVPGAGGRPVAVAIPMAPIARAPDGMSLSWYRPNQRDLLLQERERQLRRQMVELAREKEELEKQMQAARLRDRE